MTNRDLLKSMVRTLVPVVVGLVVSGAARVGLDLDPAVIGVWLDGVVIAGYYGVVRVVEHRFSAVGWLLGLPAEPSYKVWTADAPPS